MNRLHHEFAPDRTRCESCGETLGKGFHSNAHTFATCICHYTASGGHASTVIGCTVHDPLYAKRTERER